MSISLQTRNTVVAIFVSAAITVVFLLPFCGFMYKCGCTYLWAGSAETCNIHLSGVAHCPWCVRRNPVLMVLPFVVILAGQGFSIHLLSRRYHLSLLQLLVVGIAVFLLLGALNGYVFKVWDDYPYFF
ncbi:MAG: hypothetical protein D6743_09750 [Calditrichaeota bacterium]|nr:MAG: hypothetical protein D6743_09750 [Calditrichota bacterium]